MTNRFIVEFSHTQTSFSVLDFRQFRRMVNAIDMRQMALRTDDAHDVAILSPPHTDRCFVLTLCEVVHLRDLLNGAGFMLDLNRMLSDCGCSFPEEVIA
ncbi:hypothetical protein [Arsenicibacter rosenii]|uniref:hypothetical protein n=1 Tax=Arsenicibacter rosenii TaxID=1750698 RepID=UPI001E37E32A|nr:hypothetical protein [Arsenicibacter rosenii]